MPRPLPRVPQTVSVSSTSPWSLLRALLRRVRRILPISPALPAANSRISPTPLRFEVLEERLPPGALGHLFLGAGMLGLNGSINAAAPPAASSRGSRISDPPSSATPTPNAGTPTKSQKDSEKSSESSSHNNTPTNPTNDPNGSALDALLALDADGENFLADPLAHRAGRKAERSAGSPSESARSEAQNAASSGQKGASNPSAPPSQSPSSSRGVAESKRSAELDALTAALNRPETPAVRPHKGSRPFRPGKGKGGGSGEGGGGGISLFSFSNTPPVAVNDAYYVHQGQMLNPGTGYGVLENDTDDDYDPLTAEIVADPSHGSVYLSSDGTFSYTPDSGYVGTDSFTRILSPSTTRSRCIKDRCSALGSPARWSTTRTATATP